MKKLWNFNSLLFCSSLFIASCAAYYSILGIAMLFSGSKIAAMVMATSLEIGKLVSTSYLFKYWKDTRIFLKTYLTLSVFILMFITSIGTFGYLTAAYQKSSLDNKFSSEKIMVLEDKKSSLTNSIYTAQSKIKFLNEQRSNQEKRFNDLLTNTVIVRNPIQFQEIQTQNMELIQKNDLAVKLENERISQAQSDIDGINSTISQMKLESLGKSDIVTFKFVSDELGMKMDTVVKWFIVLIISVFDPLAISLLLAYNTSSIGMSRPKVDLYPTVDEENKEKKILTESPSDSKLETNMNRRHNFLSNFFRNK